MQVTLKPQQTVDEKIRLSSWTLTESPIDSMREELDANAKIITKTGQFAEKGGWWVAMWDEKNELQAAVIVAPASISRFQKITNIPADALNNTVALSSVWISPLAIQHEVLPAILYMGLRRARILGCHNVAALVPIPNRDIPYATLMKLERLDNWPSVKQDGVELLALAQQIKYSMSCLYEQCEGESLWLINNRMIDEVVETHRAWLNRFYKGPWARAVINGTLTKQQYLISLYNIHEYVRQTTRLAARCVAYSENIELRNHYINHFKGEINHELLVERDVKNLGGDLVYLKEKHIPDPSTKDFMFVQESTIGFHEDPILMLACPMAAEGIAANMPDGFIDALYKVIASWGVKKPEECARFLSSHINTDGGDDGHWALVVESIKKYIRTEWQLQSFLAVLWGAMLGMEQSFNANIEELKIWSVKPKA